MLKDFTFLTKGQQWPPKEEEGRLSTYKDNRKLFESQHDLVFKDWARLMNEDHQATLHLILNWHKRLSTLWADLLFGEPPKFSAGDPDSPEQAVIDRINTTNRMVSTSYEVALDVSIYGTGLYKVRFDRKRGAIVEGLTPNIWFPVVSPSNIKDIQAHVIAYDVEKMEKDAFGRMKKAKFLNVEIHEIGKITYQVWRLDDGQLKRLISQEEQETNIDDFMIVPVNNLLTTRRTTGFSDYQDINTLVQELEVRCSQISRILNKHADPNMAGPESGLELDLATGTYRFRAGGKYFPEQPGDPQTRYVTWDGQLEAAFKEIETLMEQLYTVSETSPAAFGQLKAGLVESGAALKRLMMAPLAKVNRIRMNFDPALKNVFDVCTDLEVANHFPKAIDAGDLVKIDWQDGLPVDDMEQTNLEVARYTSGLSSLESSLRRLYGYEGKKLEHEIFLIHEEEAAANPMHVANHPMATHPGQQQGGGNNGGD